MSNIVELFNQDVRHIVTKFELFIYGTQKPPLLLTDEDFVMDSSVLEEASAEGDTPLGAVSSNELVITLQNSDKRFSLNNEQSPYYNLLVPGTKVVAKHCIETEEDKYEETLVGTFYTTAWKSDTGSIIAGVTCHDRLYTLGELEVPEMPPCRKVTLNSYISDTFNALGIAPNSYQIDPSINYILDYAWYPKIKLKEFLQRLALGYGCLIYVDRNDLLVIQSNYTQGEVSTVMTDNNQILSLSVPQEILSLYTRIDLTYYRPQMSDRKVLLELKDITLQEGLNELVHISFNTTPVVRLDSIVIEGGGEVQVVNWEHDSWEISLKVNKSATKFMDNTYTIIATGYTIDRVEQHYTLADIALQQRIGERTLKLTSEIIQHHSAAKSYCQRLLGMVTQLDTVLDLDCRGNSALGVGDLVRVEDATNKIHSNYVVQRVKLDHNGALTGSMKLCKVVTTDGLW